jgi:hypothetical protein
MDNGLSTEAAAMAGLWSRLRVSGGWVGVHSVASLVCGALATSFRIRCLPARLVLASLAASFSVRGLAACLVLGGLAACRALRRLAARVILRRPAQLAALPSTFPGVVARAPRTPPQMPEDARHDEPSLDPIGMRVASVLTHRARLAA